MKSPVLNIFGGRCFRDRHNCFILVCSKTRLLRYFVRNNIRNGASPKGERKRKQIPKKKAEGNGLFG